jgi:deazaflavin-dependent oxidoreductase (nitroreductase family)
MAQSAPKPYTRTQEKIAGPIIKAMSHVNTWLYRATGGKIGGKFRYGAPVMLLSYTGRKSGKRMTAPLLYLRDGERVVTVASKGGMSKHPLWFVNLQAIPDCEVEIGREKRAMRARRASDEEKAQYWPKLVAIYPDYDLYQRRTTRNIPVVILEPR